MKIDKKLQEINRMIRSYQDLTVEYPLCDSYKESLAKLIQARVDYVNTIGRLKK